MAEIHCPDPLVAVGLHPDGSRLATGHAGGEGDFERALRHAPTAGQETDPVAGFFDPKRVRAALAGVEVRTAVR